MVNNMAKEEPDAPKEREYTSFRVQPQIWKDVKIKAIQRDEGVSDFVENSLSLTMELLDNKEKGEKVLMSILRKRLGVP